MPEYKFTKILLQVLLVMKHKQNQMPQEKKNLTFYPEGIQAKQERMS